MEDTRNGGIGLLGALFLILLVLKVTGIGTFSWWWLALPFAIWLGIVIIVFLLYGMAALIRKYG